METGLPWYPSHGGVHSETGAGVQCSGPSHCPLCALQHKTKGTVITSFASMLILSQFIQESKTKKTEEELLIVSNPAEWVEKRFVSEYLEPTVIGTIISPSEYLPGILELCHSKVSPVQAIPTQFNFTT